MGSDRRAVDAVIRAAFAGKLYSNGTEAVIAERLFHAGATLSLVACDGESVVGHAAFSPISVGGAEINWHALGPLAVAPPVQQQGIGSQLVNEGLRQLRARSSLGCVLIGDPNYYSRFGFRHFDTFVSEVHPGAAMVLPFCDDVPTGCFRFHPAFD